MSNSGANFESLLPSSVVIANLTGGIPEWKAKTEYKINQLASVNGITFICLTKHTSGESFSGIGTNWNLLGGAANGVNLTVSETTGTITCDLSKATSFNITFTGNSVIKPTNIPNFRENGVFWTKQDAVGGHTWSFEVGKFLPVEPTFALRKEELVGIAYSVVAGELRYAVIGGTL
jgi:hypothetical protein